MQNDKTQRARRKRSLGRDIYELLGSMRFAVSLLTFIAIATIIGTVLEQNQTEIQYIDKFGTYWYSVFRKFDVHDIKIIAVRHTWRIREKAFESGQRYIMQSIFFHQYRIKLSKILLLSDKYTTKNIPIALLKRKNSSF